MIYQIGKRFRTRHGRIVVISGYESSEEDYWPVSGYLEDDEEQHEMGWDRRGRFLDELTDHRLDLIAEVL